MRTRCSSPVRQRRRGEEGLQVQHLVALGPGRLEAARLVVIEDRLDDRFGLVDHLHQIEIGRRDHAFADELVAHPVDQPAPELAADQDDRHLAALAGLHQRQALGQLVERAEAAGHHDVGRREVHEHHLAREEMAEVEADVLVRVAGLLVRQLDVEADRRRASREGALVGRFHDARAAAGDHAEAGVGQQARDVLGQLVIRMIRP